MHNRHHAFIWSNVGFLLIGAYRTNFKEIWIEIPTFLSRKCVWIFRLESGGHVVSTSMPCLRFGRPNQGSCQVGIQGSRTEKTRANPGYVGPRLLHFGEGLCWSHLEDSSTGRPTEINAVNQSFGFHKLYLLINFSLHIWCLHVHTYVHKYILDYVYLYAYLQTRGYANIYTCALLICVHMRMLGTLSLVWCSSHSASKV